MNDPARDIRIYGTAEHAAVVAEGRHPGIRDGLQWLTFAHLPEALQRFSRPFYAAAIGLVETVTTDSPELTTAINRLIEAKDSAVRAGIRHDTGRAGSVPRPQTVVDPPKFVECGMDTPSGPCCLRSDHPVGPMHPGHNGHLAREVVDPPVVVTPIGDTGRTRKDIWSPGPHGIA